MAAAVDLFPALSGQDDLARRLRRLAVSPPQTLLLEGGSAKEREAAALYWAAQLNCAAPDPESGPCGNCPACRQIVDRAFSDLYYFDGLEGSIKIDDVREVRSVWGQPPNGDGHRVTIFAEAQELTIEAANALLKSLEEPRPGNVFVLLAPQRERLLETLVSRSWVLALSWPDARRTDAEAEAWCRALLEFWRSGRGWFPRTSAKGAVDRPMALRVVLGCQRELLAAMSGRGGTPVSDGLRTLFDGAGLRRLDRALAQCQDALNYQVSPSLVLDWLATAGR